MDKPVKVKVNARNMHIRDTREDKIVNVVVAVLLVIIGVAAFYPLWLVLIASISDPTYLAKGEVYLFPKGIMWEAYEVLFEKKEIWIGYRNSIFYTVVGTALQMFVTTTAAFALSRKTLPGRSFLSLYFLFIMYFSGGLIPTFFVIQNLGMMNTVWALLIPGVFGPYNMIIARTYFQNSIPEEIYESAQLEGASMFRCFFQLAVPLAKPTLAVILLTFALGHWNSYFNAMIYISNDNIQTLQVFIKRITSRATATLNAGNMENAEIVIEELRKEQLLKYAVVIVSSVPMIALYPFVRKYFVAGIMIGAVKG